MVGGLIAVDRQIADVGDANRAGTARRYRVDPRPIDVALDLLEEPGIGAFAFFGLENPAGLLLRGGHAVDHLAIDISTSCPIRNGKLVSLPSPDGGRQPNPDLPLRLIGGGHFLDRVRALQQGELPSRSGGGHCHQPGHFAPGLSSGSGWAGAGR